MSEQDPEQYPSMVPLDGDPEASRQPVDEGSIRGAVSLLRDVGNLENDRQADQVTLLVLRDAARGREVHRMQSLVMELTSGAMYANLQAEIDLLTEQLRSRVDELVQMGEEHRAEMERVGQQRAKDEERRGRTADRARQHYSAWMSACVRLERQAQIIRSLKDELARFQGGEG